MVRPNQQGKAADGLRSRDVDTNLRPSGIQRSLGETQSELEPPSQRRRQSVMVSYSHRDATLIEYDHLPMGIDRKRAQAAWKRVFQPGLAYMKQKS